MTMKLRKVIVPLLLATLAIAACKVTNPYRRPSQITGSGLYRDTTITDTATIADVPWKQFFTDTILQRLIEEGVRNNLDIGIAVARIHEAEANFRQSKEAFLPSLNAGANASVQTAGTTTSRTYEAYLSSSWQVDIWGKLRSTRRAQLASLLQSDAFRRDVQTQLVTSIATD